MLALLTSITLGCGDSQRLTSAIPPAREPSPIPSNPVCASSSRLGFWVGDCLQRWCLPVDADLVFSVNVNRRFAYSNRELPRFAAALDRAQCPEQGGAYRVLVLDLSFEFVGANLFMFDPVRQCADYECGGEIEDQWAVKDPSRLLYDLKELSLAEFLDAYGPN